LRGRIAGYSIERLGRLLDDTAVAGGGLSVQCTRLDGETDAEFNERVAKEQKRRKAEQVGDTPRPPRYKSSDFQSADCWRLRGALDVPKSRMQSRLHAFAIP
jgi:hypothetical protein